MRHQVAAIVAIFSFVGSPIAGRTSNSDDWLKAFEGLWSSSRTPPSGIGTSATASSTTRLGDLHDRVIAKSERTANDVHAEFLAKSVFSIYKNAISHLKITCAAEICEIALSLKPSTLHKSQRISDRIDDSIYKLALSLKGTNAIGSGLTQGKYPKLFKIAYITYNEKDSI